MNITLYFARIHYSHLSSLEPSMGSGPATVIIQGIGIGMISCVAPVVILVATIFGCNALAGGYGIALSAVGMLSTLGVTLATDAYGPVSAICRRAFRALLLVCLASMFGGIIIPCFSPLSYPAT